MAVVTHSCSLALHRQSINQRFTRQSSLHPSRTTFVPPHAATRSLSFHHVKILHRSNVSHRRVRSRLASNVIHLKGCFCNVQMMSKKPVTTAGNETKRNETRRYRCSIRHRTRKQREAWRSGACRTARALMHETRAHLKMKKMHREN